MLHQSVFVEEERSNEESREVFEFTRIRNLR